MTGLCSQANGCSFTAGRSFVFLQLFFLLIPIVMLFHKSKAPKKTLRNIAITGIVAKIFFIIMTLSSDLPHVPVSIFTIWTWVILFVYIAIVALAQYCIKLEGSSE